MKSIQSIVVPAGLSLIFIASPALAGGPVRSTPSPININKATQRAGNTITNGSPSASSGSTSGVSSTITSNPSATAGASSDPYQGTDVRIKNEAAAIPPVIVAPGLTAGAITCLGSKSGGVSVGTVGVGAGATFGSTVESERCNARADAATLVGLGESDVAKARLCQVEAIAQAYAASGKPCASSSAKATAPITVPPSAIFNEARVESTAPVQGN